MKKKKPVSPPSNPKIEQGPSSVFYLSVFGSGILFIVCLIKFLPVDTFFTDSQMPNEEFYPLRFSRFFWGIMAILFIAYPGILISKTYKKNWVLPFIATVIALLLAESGMMYYTKSDGIGNTMAHSLWHRKFGYDSFLLYEQQLIMRGTAAQGESCVLREEPKLDSSFCKKKKYYLVGDSFTWGDGIDLPKNTFAGVLAQKLQQKYPEQYAIFNLGDRGADTYREEKTLMHFAIEYTAKTGCPSLDGVVWQYYMNDIDQVSANHGNKIKSAPVSGISEWGGNHLMGKSFLFDYIYWKYFTSKHDTYTDFIKQAFQNDTLVQEHLKPIIRVGEESKKNNIRFTVLLFPLLTDTEFSKQQYKKVIALLEKNHIEYIDMTNDVAKLPLKDRIVNERNLHPSEQLHKMVGDKLFSFLFP